MAFGVGIAGGVAVLILLLGIGYVTGRLGAGGDARGAYLAFGSLVGAIALAAGFGIALEGTIRYTLPKTVAVAEDSRPPLPVPEGLTPTTPRTEVIPTPRDDVLRDAPTPPADEQGSVETEVSEAEGSPPVEDRALESSPEREDVEKGGLIRIFRGGIVLLSAGFFLVLHRRLAPPPAKR